MPDVRAISLSLRRVFDFKVAIINVKGVARSDEPTEMYYQTAASTLWNSLASCRLTVLIQSH